MTMLPFRYSLRSLVARRGSTASTVIGIAAVVFLLASSFMLSNGVRSTFSLAANEGDAIVLRLGAEGEGNSVFEATKAAVVLARDEIARGGNGRPAAVAEVVVNAAMDRVGDDGVANVQIRGIDENARSFRPEVRITRGRWPRPGAPEAMIGDRIAGRFRGLELGRSFELRRNRPVVVVGTFSANGSSLESEIFVDRDLVRSAYGREGTVSSIRVRVPGRFDRFAAGIEGDRRLGLRAMRASDYYAKQSMSTSTFVSVLGGAISAFFALAAVVSGTTTMHSAVSRRRREIGVLRALGFSRTSILVSFLVESILVALVGGALGVLAALAMGTVRFSMMNFASWSEIVFRLEPKPEILLVSFAGALVVGVFGGLAPAIRAARVPPVAVLKG